MDKNLTDCVQRLKAIFVLSGGIVQDTSRALGWRQLEGLEQDKTGPMPSKERTIAAAQLWRLNPSLILVLSGGKCREDQPAIADVMEEDALALGVPQFSIRKVGGTNTQEQLALCAHFAHERGWTAREVAIASVSFHFGRIAAMLQALQEPDMFSWKEKSPVFISAERVLMEADRERWQKHFLKIYSDPAMFHVLAQELLGTAQLLTGQQPKHPNPFRGFEDPLKNLER